MIPDLCNSPGRCAFGFAIVEQHPALCQCTDADEWARTVTEYRAALINEGVAPEDAAQIIPAWAKEAGA